MLHHLPVLKDFQEDPEKTSEEQLTELLELFGRDPKELLPRNNGDQVNVGKLLQQIPKTHNDGVLNAAHEELQAFYYAVDPKLRRKGVYLPAETLVALLLERLEFFEHLSRNLARVCGGKDCPHFKVCRFRDIVSNVTKDDGILCAVERELIKNHIEQFVTPKSGDRPSVDPRRPEMAFLFHQLMQLVVAQVRYSMYMQVENLSTKQYDKLRQQDGSEIPAALNDIEHPLMAGWQKTTREIQNVLQKMGRTPEFMQRQGLIVEEGEKADAEARALEMVLETYNHMLAEAEEGSTEYTLIQEAIETTRQMSEDDE